MNYKTKDSGKRAEYNSGMRRDTQEGKPDFYLLVPEEMPYDELLLTRWAALMTRGKEKYGNRNWELANTEEELERFKSSAFRHFIQAMSDEDDEDHFAAVCFNLNAILYLRWKLKRKQS
jgi:hypothetical protein